MKNPIGQPVMAITAAVYRSGTSRALYTVAGNGGGGDAYSPPICTLGLKCPGLNSKGGVAMGDTGWSFDRGQTVPGRA